MEFEGHVMCRASDGRCWADDDDTAYLIRSVENSFLGITQLAPNYLGLEGGICSQTPFQVSHAADSDPINMFSVCWEQAKSQMLQGQSGLDAFCKSHVRHIPKEG